MTAPRLQRERLPDPPAYFASIGLALAGKGGAWRSAICPFHDDTAPSLRVNVHDGHWRCMACGAKGRDVLAFEQQRTGADFSTAARALGAWR